MNAVFFPSGRYNTLLSKGSSNGQAGLWLSCLSFFFHILFMAALFVMPKVAPPRILPQVVQVDLVSFDPGDMESQPLVTPEPASAQISPDPFSPDPVSAPNSVKSPVKLLKKPQAKILKKPVVVESESRKVPVVVPEEKLVAKPKKIVKKKVLPTKKKALKSKTYKPEKVLESARKNLKKDVEKNVAAESQKSLNQALARLQKIVNSESRPSGRTGTASGKQGGKQASRAIELYNLELMYRIQQNWAFNQRLAGGDGNLEVSILIKILKGGNLRDIFVETRSGNRYLDESALKAIKKSVPLPKLPKGYSDYDVGLIFTPAGLK